MLLTSQQSGEVATKQTVCESGSVEALRQILIAQEQREVSRSEAQETGATLLEFYQILAEEAGDDPES